MLKEGDKAPDFCLEGLDENGENAKIGLENFKDEQLILYFYPKDDTPGCTSEACSFNENLNNVTRFGAVLVGVSPDNIQSHKSFREKFNLNFSLLCDPDKKVATLYGAYGEKKLYGRVFKGIIRSTFIIERGRIKKAWRNIRVKGHVNRVLNSFK
jgi:peroxiredoxin Q/BCP|tara:strand:+ start:2872 stop:3336 length:465 start_codon:yes stop_codon:yes gene_type:complete